MSRHRSLSTEISTDTQVAELAEHGPEGLLPLLLYTWAIPHADDWGRMTGDPRQFRLLVCPGLDVTARDVDDALTAIGDTGLWLRYEVGGKRYIAFPPQSWFKHQNYIPKSKRGKDGSTIPAPEHPAFQLPEAPEENEENSDSPQIPANPRALPRIAADPRKSPQNPASPSPSPSLTPSPTVDTTEEGSLRENNVAAVPAILAPALSLGALALSPTPHANNVVPLKPVPKPSMPPTMPPKPSMPAALTERAQLPTRRTDDLWDACVAACGGIAPSNRVERGKWNAGLKALRESGATPEEIALRAVRYRRRYGERIALNPMALAGNWTILATEVTEVTGHADTAQGNSSRSGNGGNGGSYRRGVGAGRVASPSLPDADWWKRYADDLERQGRLAKG